MPSSPPSPLRALPRYAFQNTDFLCLVMDLVPSGDLSEFVLTPKRLTPEQTQWAMMEVVEVLAYMHAQKILYRDLKPENLLVDDEGHVRPPPSPSISLHLPLPPSLSPPPAPIPWYLAGISLVSRWYLAGISRVSHCYLF